MCPIGGHTMKKNDSCDCHNKEEERLSGLVGAHEGFQAIDDALFLEIDPGDLVFILCYTAHLYFVHLSVCMLQLMIFTTVKEKKKV